MLRINPGTVAPTSSILTREYVDGVSGIWEMYTLSNDRLEYTILHFDAELPAEMELAIRSVVPRSGTREVPELARLVAPRLRGVQRETVLAYLREFTTRV